ncbi:hypothetical protein D8S78_23845 [Natrialba swarupiae]|nr:hypothetical protein [Natrialba swarupiae]
MRVRRRDALPRAGHAHVELIDTETGENVPFEVGSKGNSSIRHSNVKRPHYSDSNRATTLESPE